MRNTLPKKTLEENESAPADEGTGKWSCRHEPAEDKQAGPLSPRVPPEKSENQMQHMHLSMQETMRNNEIVPRSKDTKAELEAGLDSPRGGIKNLPRGELELDVEEKTDRRKPARL